MSKKLLLADDSITIQKVIGITFANEDYDLTVVGDGDAAFEKALADRPDLVLADVFMPGKNGYELCAAIKQDSTLKGVPVLLLTGTFEPFDEAKAAASGADSWIAKPFESQALIDRVENLLAHSVQTPPEEGKPAEEAAVPAPADLPPETDDIWADLSRLVVPTTESDEPVGLEEAFAPTAVADDEMKAATAEDDIWQSLGAELPAEAEATPPLAAEEVEPSVAPSVDPFAFPEAEEEPADEVDPFSFADAESPAEESTEVFMEEPLTGAEDPFSFAEEEPEASGAFVDPFAEEIDEPEQIAPGEEWGEIEPATGGNADEAVWDTFDDEDEEILALEEDDILEELEPLEDEELLAVADTSGDQDAETIGEFPVGAEDDLSTAEIAWAPDQQEAEHDEGEYPPLAEGMFVGEAAGDFLEAEDQAEADAFRIEPEGFQEDEGEEGFVPPSEDPFAADYAFSLEEEAPPAAAAVPAQALDQPPVAAAALPVVEPPRSASVPVEEKVAALTDADIERIVERVAGTVIERLAKTMLERIAWEVVPDLAESMIKDEIRKIREEVQ